MIYGYARISRKTQNIDRQIRNIITNYPDAKIYQETYTGTKIDGRREFNKLLKIVRKGDTIVFDSVSRMSRNADQGIDLYMQLYESGIDLVFLKEGYINTSVYKNAMSRKLDMTGNKIVDAYLNTTNEVLMMLAIDQIKIAFDHAQKEVDDLHERTKEGIEIARKNGKQIGQVKGCTYNIKKKEPIKREILKKSSSFNGYMSDKDLIKVLGIARNTYYKYKKELAAEQVTGE